MLSLFETVQNESTREMMEEQLKGISDAHHSPAVKKNPPVPAEKKFTAPIPDDQYEALPEEVKKLNSEKDELFKEFSYLHNRLSEYEVLSVGHTGRDLLVSFNNYTNEDEAGVDALRLLELEDRLKKYWSDLDFFANHGKLPDKQMPVIKEMTIVEAVKRRNNLRTYISRDPESKNMQAWKDEVDEIERRYDL